MNIASKARPWSHNFLIVTTDGNILLREEKTRALFTGHEFSPKVLYEEEVQKAEIYE